jgi:hypothetical protein
MDNLKKHIQNNLDDLNIDQPMAELWTSISNKLHQQAEGDILKGHIQQHANEFEIETPEETAWNNIEKQVVTIKPARTIKIQRLISYAAAACVVVFIGWRINIYIDKSTNKPTDPVVVKQPAVNNPEKTNTISGDTINKGVAMELPVDKPALEKLQKPGNESRLAANPSTATKKRAAVKTAKTPSLPSEVLQIQSDYDNLIASQVKHIQSMALYGENPGYFEGFITDFKLLDNKEKQLRKNMATEGLQENSINELAMIYQQKLMVLKKLQTEIDKTSSRTRNITDSLPAYIKL